VWVRNLVFVGLSLTGLAVVTAGLLQSDREREPESFDPARYASDDYRPVLDEINRQWEAHWQTLGLQPAAPADEITIARRLSEALAGTIPSLEEIRNLEVLSAEQRLDWYVSRLIEDRRTSDYLAERLARAYVGTENGPFLVYRRRRFVTWLSDRLHQNTPYNELAATLISDTGLWTDSPAVNFVTVTLDQNNDNQPDPIRLAGRTARAFLGVRIDCLQCHDDALGNVQLGTEVEPRFGEQRDFHQLAAYFSEARSSLTGVRDRNQKPYEYKFLHAEEDELVEPAPPFLPHLMDASEAPRRLQLARWVTHPENPAFARTIVNRIWGLMFGKPLVEPIDDIPLFGDLPPGMQVLADDFVAHGYDLRRLIRLIAATRVFQLDSRADFDVTPAHESAWAVFPLTRLRPEQVAGSIIQASSLTTIDADSHVVAQLRRFGEQNDFVSRYGDTGEDEFDERAGTIAQRLLLMNGSLVSERTKENLVLNAATRIAVLAPDDAKAIETAYLVVLSRRPSPSEAAHFATLLDGTSGSERSRRLEDLYWVLINSTEFSWNH